MKENKFMMGEEEENNSKIVVNMSNTVPTSHKKPIRHHVKRRSSGRVHVAKIAPLARANAAHTDSEAELGEENNTERPVMRRSQSQRSLNRLSFDRKGFGPLTAVNNNSNKKKTVKVENKEKINFTSTHVTNNPASLSNRVIAEPIEQTFHATANNLVIPKKAVYPQITSPLKKTDVIVKKPFLRSQFISTEERRNETVFHNITSRNNNLSRTQQKLMLQRQQSQLEDETSPIHPRNMQKINKEMELLNREYKCIKKYQDPIKDSLIRCLNKNNHHNSNRIQLNQQSISSFVVPTLSQVNVPHLEQRQIAHRHHHLKSIALSRNNNYSNNNHSISCSTTSDHSSVDKNQSILGITTAFLDRMFNNNN